MNSTPFFVKATRRIPTGMPNKAEISAMCSFPVPEAIERATSKSFPIEDFNF